ncbi:MAG: branched-chain amino acid ABC transporter permease [Anaerolineae bacterium]
MSQRRLGAEARWVRLARWLIITGTVIGLLLLPPHLSGYRLRFLTLLFLWIAMASNWNLIAGYTGYVDFGHAVFFGLGAYFVGILMVRADPAVWVLDRLGQTEALTLWLEGALAGANPEGLLATLGFTGPGEVLRLASFLLALLAAGLGSGLFALTVGLPTLRLKGPYFSIAMLGTLIATREIVRNLKPLTGGGEGLTFPMKYYPEFVFFYFMALLVMLLSVATVAWISRSQIGYALRAIREDEGAADMRGINTTLHKVQAFVLAAALTGLAGGVRGYWDTYIEPDSMFVEQMTVQMVMMTMLGGIGRLWGPVLGAVTLYYLQEVVWANLLKLHLIALGLLLIAIVLYLPGGLLGLIAPNGFTARDLIRRWAVEPTEEAEAAHD